MADSGEVQREVEKMMRYRYYDSERARSNKAAGLADLAQGTKRRCPLRHDMIAWVGPPHDKVRAYVCLRCNAAASEPEIKDRGFNFDTIPDWEIEAILDLDLDRQSAMGNPRMFGGFDANPGSDGPSISLPPT